MTRTDGRCWACADPVEPWACPGCEVPQVLDTCARCHVEFRHGPLPHEDARDHVGGLPGPRDEENPVEQNAVRALEDAD